MNDPPFFTMDYFHAMGDMTTGLEHWLYADDIDSDIFFTLEGAPAWISLDGSKMVGQPADQPSLSHLMISKQVLLQG